MKNRRSREAGPSKPTAAGDAQPVARLDIKAVPRAARTEAAGWLGARLKVRIAAPPEDGRANEALEAYLAEELGLPRRSVRVAIGHGSATKTVTFDGLDQSTLDARIRATFL